MTRTAPAGARAQENGLSGMAHGSTTEVSNTTDMDVRAQAFVRARLAAKALPAYPGALPATLAEAYAIQDQAIRLWPGRIAGWKVGRINPPWDNILGTDRLAGPIFTDQVVTATGTGPVDAFVLEGGFGAVEGEIILVCGEDAPEQKTSWSLEEAAEMVGSALIGAEIASSPFAEINDHGPLVTISDFGNNNGLILGQALENWRQADWLFRTRIDGASVGTGKPDSIPGGPLESLRALLEITASRGLPLRRGMYVSTGAVTGVHQIQAGQTAAIEVDGRTPIHLRLLPARPVSRETPAQES